jgi:hypothetical protein
VGVILADGLSTANDPHHFFISGQLSQQIQRYFH